MYNEINISNFNSENIIPSINFNDKSFVSSKAE